MTVRVFKQERILVFTLGNGAADNDSVTATSKMRHPWRHFIHYPDTHTPDELLLTVLERVFYGLDRYRRYQGYGNSRRTDTSYKFTPFHKASSNSIKPAAVLALAQRLFDKKPKGYMLAIRGYEFNQFGQLLSQRAADNLAAATQFLESLLLHGDFDQAKR